MKIRKGFVSNSSSSSYVIDVDLSAEGIACFKLTQEMLGCIEDSLGVELPDPDKDWYLTELICSDADYEKIPKLNFIYMDGQMSGVPYETDEGAYAGIEVAPGIWLYPKDAPGEIITRSELMQRLPKRCKFLYKVADNGSIILTTI